MSTSPTARTSSVANIRSTLDAVRTVRGRARQFRRIFEASFVPMVLVDNRRRYTGSNAAARLLFRLSQNELLTRRIDDLTPPRELLMLEEKWERLMRNG